VQAEAFVVVLNVFAPQAVQTRSLADVPGVETNFPAAQLAHVAQLVAFAVELKEPDAHETQLRLVVEVPDAVTYSPGSHVAHASQLA